MIRYFRSASWLCCALLISSCGGGGGLSGAGGPVPLANSLPVVVDEGPAALVSSGYVAVNTLYATLTICTPGSAAQCQQIDHMQIDTGSVGIEILSEALTGGAAAPTAQMINGAPLRECVQFADGYTWGSIAVADVQIGGRTIASLPIHLIGDAAAGTAPSSCSSGAGPSENTVAAFGANGVIGIGFFLQDCGAYCASPPAVPAAYYDCPSAGCAPTTVPLNQQLQNPVAQLGADNNGVEIVLPSVTETGQATVNGTVYFGVGTQADNLAGGAQWLTVDPNQGTLLTNFNGAALTGSIIDSGSNGYFFDDTALAVCADNASFFCPITSGGAASSVPLTASIQGDNGSSSAIAFTAGNADTLFNTTALLTAFPTLAGPNGSVAGSVNGFDWGLPFFFSRSVYILFETNTIGGTLGPAVGL